MKYIVDHVTMASDDTVATLRKKVAQRLGVKQTGLRINIIRRRWRRCPGGGNVEVRVEAETHEFIHNTAYFPDAPEEVVPAPSHLKYPPVVVGFGISGIIAAFMLAKQGLRPIVLEAGMDLSSRESKTKSLTMLPNSGEGGQSALSGALFTPDLLPAPLRDALAAEGIEFNTLDAHQYLPPAFIKSVVRQLHNYIVRAGGQVLFGARFLSNKRRFGKLRGLYYSQNDERKFLKANQVIFANGQFNDSCFLGFAVEGKARSFNQCVYGRPTVDPKAPPYFQRTIFRTKEGDRCLILTGLPSPTLMDLGSNQELLEHAFEFNGKNHNAMSFVGLEVPLEVAQNTEKGAYASGKGYTIPYSLVSDFLSRRDPLRLGNVKPADVSKAQIRSFYGIVGEKIATSIASGLFQISKAFPYLIEDGALIGGLICLRGCQGTDYGEFAKKDVHVVSILPENALDFASLASAGYRAYQSLCRHANKAH